METYYTLKDLRNAARSVERNVVPGEPIRLAQEWHDVDKYCREILSSDSKDVEVLAWAAEAQVRLNGYRGLRDIFAAATELFGKYWQSIHSVGDDSVEEKIAPFAGLNGVSGEGTLIQAIRLTPLVPAAGGFASHTLWDYQLGQRPGEEQRREMLYEAAADAGREAMSAHLADVTDCIAAFDALTAMLDAKCGPAAPPSANTRNVLLEVAAAIRDLAGLGAGETIAAPSATQNISTPDAPVTPMPPAHGSAAVGSREEAFDALLTIARYFRRTEPHSPISMAIETLVRRGRMDFSELLSELLPEPQARRAVLTAAGIQPKPDESQP